MRGADITQEALFTTIHLEEFSPKSHPLRKIRQEFNLALQRIDWLLDYAFGSAQLFRTGIDVLPGHKERIPLHQDAL